jgi:hypothetical protein
MWAGATVTVTHPDGDATNVTIAVTGDAGQIGTITAENDYGFTVAWASGITTDDQTLIVGAKSLTVTGNINSADMKTLSKNIQNSVQSLDLGGATFVGEITTTYYTNGTILKHSFMDYAGVGGSYGLQACTYVVLPKPSTSYTTLPSDFNDWCPKAETVIISEGYTSLGNSAFAQRYSSNLISSVELPSTLTAIGDNAFYMQNLSKIVFPNSLVSIGAQAFKQNHLTTVEFPSTFNSLGADVFSGNNLKDVYFLGTKAPDYVAADAFGSAIQCGNNGFNKSNINSITATRADYINGSGWLCMLHYPTGLTDAQKNAYRDPTRIYLSDGLADHSNTFYTPGKETTDLKSGSLQATTTVNYGYSDEFVGTEYIWPCHSQFNRAYVVAQNGFEWDGITTLESMSAGASTRLGLYSFVFNSEDVDPTKKN